MKTLKRTLCLVLALVLALGTMGVASAAYDDFTDADEINAKYAEAVEVTTALGIIDGMTDTTFVPDGNLTRAQAAKIISYIMFGDAASLIVPSETKFTDVPADYWASGYIAALTEVGVIAGMTDTTFAPNATLTGHQWAKMLLCAMGYAGNLLTGYDEIFEGQFWTANVAKYAKTAGLLAVMEDDYFLGDVIAREEAVQMGFYAMLNPYANAVKSSVIQLVPDGKGGYILKVVITDIESLAWENYGLGVVDGNIYKGALVGYDQDGVSKTMDLYEDVSALECKHNDGRHVYAWGIYNDKTGNYDQLTDVNILDSITTIDNDYLAAFQAKLDACKNMNEKDALISATFNVDDEVPVFFNAEYDDSLEDIYDVIGVLDWLDGRIPADETIKLYDYESDGQYDAVLVTIWEVAKVSAEAADVPANHAYAGMTEYTFSVLHDGNKYVVYAPAGTYVAGGLYSFVADWSFRTDDDELKADQLWAENVFLSAPEPLKTVTAAVNDVEVKNPELYDAPYITFKTSAGDLNESIYYIDSIYASDWYNEDLDFTAKDYLKFNFKFYLDPIGEVVAYEIAEVTEYVAYISDFYYVAGETTQLGHHDSKTGWTVYAHCLDLDGKVISIPVTTGTNEPGSNMTAAQAVERLNDTAKQVAYFWLQPTGLYRFEQYKYAEKVQITDTEKYTYSGEDYNFTAKTDVFNVSESQGVISVDKIDVSRYHAWIVWNRDADTLVDGTDYTVTDIFYTDYKPITTETFFIAPNTQIESTDAAKNIHYVYVYIDGVKTLVPIKNTGSEWGVWAEDLQKGGFYKYEVKGGIYSIKAPADMKVEKVYQSYAEKNLISIDIEGVEGPDINISGKTFIAVGGASTTIKKDTYLASQNGVAKDSIIYIVPADFGA